MSASSPNVPGGGVGPGGSAAVAGAVAVGEVGGGVLLVAMDGAAGGGVANPS